MDTANGSLQFQIASRPTKTMNNPTPATLTHKLPSNTNNKEQESITRNGNGSHWIQNQSAIYLG